MTAAAQEAGLDAPSFLISIAPLDTAGVDEGSEIAYQVQVDPRVAVTDARVIITAGGGQVLELIPGFEPDTGSVAFLGDLGPQTTVASEAQATSPGQTLEFVVPARVTSHGPGFMSVRVYSPGVTPLALADALHLFVLTTPNRVYSSVYSVTDVIAQHASDSLAALGVEQAEIDTALDDIRSRARISVDSVLVAAELSSIGQPGTSQTGARASDTQGAVRSPPNTVTVRGHVRFTDTGGNTHPVRGVTVEIMDDNRGQPASVVHRTVTGQDGAYSATVPNVESGSDPTDGPKLDVYVRTHASNSRLHILRGQTNSILGLKSGRVDREVPDGAVVVKSVTASQSLLRPEDVAFSIYEAVGYADDYVVAQGRRGGDLLTVRYPFPQKTDYGGRLIRIEAQFGQDWDVVHHEYSHFVQDLVGMPGIGDQHSLGEDLCNSARGYSNSKGKLLAWTEGWATFNGLMMQRVLNLSALGIPGVGDAAYETTNIESARGVGEGNELSIAAFLWDLLDTNDDGADQGVNLPAATLWMTATSPAHPGPPGTLGAFWGRVTAPLGRGEVADLGALLSEQRVGAAPTAPAEGTEINSRGALRFTWDAHMPCSAASDQTFVVRVYSNDYANMLRQIRRSHPFDRADARSADFDAVFGGANGPRRWVILSRDNTMMLGQEYVSRPMTLVDRFNP